GHRFLVVPAGPGRPRGLRSGVYGGAGQPASARHRPSDAAPDGRAIPARRAGMLCQQGAVFRGHGVSGSGSARPASRNEYPRPSDWANESLKGCTHMCTSTANGKWSDKWVQGRVPRILGLWLVALRRYTRSRRSNGKRAG
nr:hypothetical protein [Tanacetum cinerariifolium]